MKRPNDPSAPSTTLLNWYPGHMAKAIREIKQRLPMVDIILEIRDARVPLSSGNHHLNAALGNKPRIIIFNKANLAEPLISKKWSEWFDKQGEPHIFIDCFDKASLKKAVTAARQLVEKNRQDCSTEELAPKSKLKMMIIGIPNTGKSTIINQLAGKSATKVADKPGQTQVQQWIHVDKNIELLDTPGVMPPEIKEEIHGSWLCAIHALPDSILDEETVAIFVINHLLSIKSKLFMERFKLESSEIGIEEVLLKIATLRGCLRAKGLPDLDRVYKLILGEFRKGDLGRVSFELPPGNN